MQLSGPSLRFKAQREGGEQGAGGRPAKHRVVQTS